MSRLTDAVNDLLRQQTMRIHYLPGCHHCAERFPCAFVRNRAGVYGVNLDEQEAGT